MSHPTMPTPGPEQGPAAAAVAAPKTKTPFMKRKWVPWVGGFLLGGIITSAGNTDTTTTTAASPTTGPTSTVRVTETAAGTNVATAVTEKATETVTAEPEAPPAPAAGTTIPGDGTFEVGSDVKPGRYKAGRPTDGMCYWARLRNTDGGIIANNLTEGPSVVVIKRTDKFFETNGCPDFVKVG